MRFVFLFFGFLGFVLVAVAGFSADRAVDLVLRDAALACVGTALLGRWFWGVLQNAVAHTAATRRAAAEAAAAAEAEASRAKASARPGAGTPTTSPGGGGTTAPAAGAPTNLNPPSRRAAAPAAVPAR